MQEEQEADEKLAEISKRIITDASEENPASEDGEDMEEAEGPKAKSKKHANQ